MNKSLSPRLKLILIFKNLCSPNYEKMFLLGLSEDLLTMKLYNYLNSILIHVNMENLKVIECNGSLNLFKDSTLLKTYSIEDVLNLKNENQLGLSLFIEWGYLLNFLTKPQKEQLMLVL